MLHSAWTRTAVWKGVHFPDWQLVSTNAQREGQCGAVGLFVLPTESSLGPNRHAGFPPASACTPVRIADSCFQWCRAPGPPRGFTAQRETFHRRLTSGYKYARDGAQRVTGVCAQPTRRTRVPLYLVSTRDTRKAKKPISEVENREKIPAACASGACSDHRRSPRRLHVPACCTEGGTD